MRFIKLKMFLLLIISIGFITIFHFLLEIQMSDKEKIQSGQVQIDFLEEYNLMHEKVLQFESEVFVPIERPKNSILLYVDEVKDMAVMTIGDHKCDNNYGKDLTVVILVICRPDGFERREIIRKSWAQQIQRSIHSKLYFTIGLTKDDSIQKRIESENAKFDDILQFNFMDHYKNLTIKSIGILRWITLYCFNTKFVYKVDDDCIVNYENLLSFCEKASEPNIYGLLWTKPVVDRRNDSKYFVSKSDYANETYPKYTAGPWLMSGSIVPLLYETAITKSLPALPFEDVYTTGVVASKANINREQLHGFVDIRIFSYKKIDYKALYESLNYCLFKESILILLTLDDVMLTNIWKNITRTRYLDCNITKNKVIIKHV